MLSKKQKKLAELVGVILGDGHLHHKANKIFITGSLWDKFYYENTLKNLFKEIFNVDSKIYKVKNKNSYFLQVENKKVFDILTLKIGMIRGAKKGRIQIPPVLIKNKKLIPFLLRGLFDTDGSIKFSKQTKGYTYYPRIRIYSQESPMINQIKYCLNVLKFNYSIYKDTTNKQNTIYHFEISGKNNFHKWMKTVGSSNPVHYTKYAIWKKFDYYDKSWDFNNRCKMLGVKY